MKALVVGSGAGGATAARELVANGMDVVLLEAGNPFKPYSRSLTLAHGMRRMGLMNKARTITKFFPPMRTYVADDDLLLVRGVTEGGTTTIACGNLVRTDKALRDIGIDLSPEFQRIEEEVGVATVPRDRWRPLSESMYDAAEARGLGPGLTPKAVDMAKCVSCGLCELGCATGAKWDSRRFLEGFTSAGGSLRTGAPVRRVLVEDGRVRGVEVGTGRSAERVDADVVVLAAGGIGNPPILRASGVEVRDRLWVDIVLTVGGVKQGADMLHEPPMVWFAEREHYIISPYIDLLVHFFHKPWRGVSIEDRVGLMIKLADTAEGSVEADGTIRKGLSDEDRTRLAEAREITCGIMEEAGVDGPFVDGLLNGGHLGGTVPLSAEDAVAMRPSWLPEGLWVADLSLVPRSQGMPTMLTAAAIGMRVAGHVLKGADGGI